MSEKESIYPRFHFSTMERYWVCLKNISIDRQINFYMFFKLDIFDHKTNGIFSLLNDECILSDLSTEKFTAKVCRIWNGNESFSSSNEHGCSTAQCFIIRHFSCNVAYSTVCSISIYSYYAIFF